MEEKTFDPGLAGDVSASGCCTEYIKVTKKCLNKSVP